MEAPLSCCGPFNLDPPSIPSRDFLVSRISRNINRGRRVRLISRQATAQLLHAAVSWNVYTVLGCLTEHPHFGYDFV